MLHRYEYDIFRRLCHPIIIQFEKFIENPMYMVSFKVALEMFLLFYFISLIKCSSIAGILIQSCYIRVIILSFSILELYLNQ